MLQFLIAYLCGCWTGKLTFPAGTTAAEADAYVKLIAAAPDLLAALVELNARVDNYWNIGVDRPTEGTINRICEAQQISKAAICKALTGTGAP